MTEGTPQKPAAGWYPDPSGSGQMREWDGEQWTQQTRAAEPVGVTASTANLGAGYGATQQPFQQSFQQQQAPAHSGQAGFFRSLFDLSFAAERSVTTGFVKVIYLIFVILLGLGWIGTVVMMFILGGIASAASSAFGGGGEPAYMMFGVLWLVFGWIPGFISVIFVRIGLELVTAQIRTSQHTAELVRLGREAATQR
ncbi:hypothetical protein JOF28_002148 [Leucobacter exalbidus]|uniref:DUF2510 domain-containing protein n=1 Tax=Leucobacter exalbidus TaxID=662960 RepID=A0A940PXH7_9MICO|nr:DUF4282 domain-containing protein [Leucobacter exalbidus]MBP1326916.1 hypothetical protein [Leucobacter exalbidus]